MVIRGSSFVKQLALVYLVSGILGGLFLLDSCIDADYYEFSNPMTEEWDVAFLLVIGVLCFVIASLLIGSFLALLWLSGRLAWSALRNKPEANEAEADTHQDE